MKTSKRGIDLIKRFEGCKLKAYRDIRGVVTVGFGHTGNVKMGDVITQARADELLAADLIFAENAVEHLVLVPLAQTQFDALVSFTYNVGAGNFGRSTLLRMLNRGDYAGAAQQFAVWTRAGKQTNVPGLVKRRAEERQLFLTKE